MLRNLVVCTFHGGFPELISNGVNGFLARKNDVGSFVDALNRAWIVPEDPALCDCFIAAGISVVKE